MAHRAEKAESESDSDDEDEDELPTSHQLIFRGHSKSVVSVSADTSGSRFVTASSDFNLKFWDVYGMDSLALNAFRSIEPLESTPVRVAKFSPDGRSVLVVPSGRKPLLYDRDGREAGSFVDGDMYLVDVKNTKGHTAEITSGAWHPTDSAVFATSSIDSTVRIWHTSNPRSQRSVIVVRPAAGGTGKVRATAVEWSRDGSLVIAGAADGALRTWDARGPFVRTAHLVKAAHQADNDITGIAVTSDKNSVASRSQDGTVKLWDLRKPATPVLSRTGLTCYTESLGLSYSPDERLLVVGTSSTESTPGAVHVLDKSDLASIQKLAMPASVTSVYWHGGTNQIFAGLANGHVHMLFSREHSTKGGNVIMAKAPKMRHIDDNAELTTSVSLSGLNDAAIEYAKYSRAKSERNKPPTEAQLPKAPNPGIWGTPSRDYVEANIAQHQDDPREALLKYQEKVEKDERFQNTDLRRNQPKKIFSEQLDDDDDAHPNKKLRIGK